MQVQIYTTLKKIMLLTGQSAYMILIKQTQVTVFTKLFTNHLSFDNITMRVGQPLPALIWGPGPRLFYLNAGLHVSLAFLYSLLHFPCQPIMFVANLSEQKVFSSSCFPDNRDGLPYSLYRYL